MIEHLEERRLLAFDPSALEQLMLEQINRMRTDPQGELPVLFSSLAPLTAPDREVQNAVDFFGVDADALAEQWSKLTPAPPLSWNSELHDAAMAHSQLMVELDMQEHVLPGEAPVDERVRDAGYNWSRLSENVFAFADSVLHAHAAFAIDWGPVANGIQDPAGHRQAIMDAQLDEIGIAVLEVTDSSLQVGPLVVTQDFATRQDYEPRLLGVVYEDLNGNSAYDAGEGLSGLQVNVTGDAGSFTTTTLSAGGYQIALPDGAYSVSVADPRSSRSETVPSVLMGEDNVKVDLVLRAITGVPGDSNGDGVFNRHDLVDVLQAGRFGTGRPATFQQGDWNRDGVFNPIDIVFALQSGTFQ